MIRNYRYSRDLTVRIVTRSEGLHFATYACVLTTSGEVLHVTEPKPFGFEQPAVDDARAWLDDQPTLTVKADDGSRQTHRAAQPRFVGRTGAGYGFRVYVDGGEAVRAVRMEEHDGEWYAMNPMVLSDVPRGALQRLGVR